MLVADPSLSTPDASPTGRGGSRGAPTAKGGCVRPLSMVSPVASMLPAGLWSVRGVKGRTEEPRVIHTLFALTLAPNQGLEQLGVTVRVGIHPRYYDTYHKKSASTSIHHHTRGLHYSPHEHIPTRRFSVLAGYVSYVLHHRVSTLSLDKYEHTP